MNASLHAAPERRLLFARAGRVAAALALPALWLGPRAAAAGALRPTPRQTEGPFYPRTRPAEADADLTEVGGRAYGLGQPVWLDGSVRDLDGRPLRGATVEIWQCDPHGRYHHPDDGGGRADPGFQGYGRVTVDDEGRYRFRTLRPSPYVGRTPHIHVKLRLGERELLTTQLYVEGDPGNARDGLWRSLSDPQDRAALTRPFVPGEGGSLRASFPIVVQA